MKYTSAEANKLVNKITEKIRMLQINESKASIFSAASSEDVEALRPEYNFAKTQEELENLQSALRTVKHAINSFNVGQTLAGFDGLTIDQALILMPQLNHRKMELAEMASRLPKERVVGYLSSNIIDYKVINYDLEEVEKKYNEVSETLSKIQLALDDVNNNVTMEIDVEI